MADSMFHQPVMGRRAFVGGTLAASSMAFLAACGKKGGDASGSESGSTLNFYINNPVCIDPYNVQEDQGTQVEYQLFDALTSYDAEKGEIVPSPSSPLTRLWPRFPSAPSPMPRASTLHRSVTARS